jgi:hypothetical protein
VDKKKSPSPTGVLHFWSYLENISIQEMSKEFCWVIVRFVEIGVEKDIFTFFFPMVQQPLEGQGLLIIEASR